MFFPWFTIKFYYVTILLVMEVVMKTVMIDMDNVITDGLFTKYIEEFYHTTVDLSQTQSYTYVQNFTRENSEEFWKSVENKDFYGDAPLLDGCFEALKKLNDRYDLYIVTAYLWKETIDLSGKNLRYKYSYLRKKLPFIGPEKYIFTTNKSMIHFDIRIDDRLHNLGGASTNLLFDAWHNRGYSDDELKEQNIIRVRNWKEIEEILL